MKEEKEMKAEDVKIGLKIDLPDQSQIEIIRDGFLQDGFQSVEYKFLRGQYSGQTEIAAVACIQEAFDHGAKRSA